MMLTIWKTVVQPKLDYCSVLWSPSDQGSISRLESIARHFSAQVSGMEDKDYWERLDELHMYSQERRRERYSIIFLWKLAQQLVRIHSRVCAEPQEGQTVSCPPHSG